MFQGRQVSLDCAVVAARCWAGDGVRRGEVAQIVDRAGTNHVRGFNRLTGAPYELTVDRNGHVQGTVGDWDIAFSVKEAA